MFYSWRYLAQVLYALLLVLVLQTSSSSQQSSSHEQPTNGTSQGFPGINKVDAEFWTEITKNLGISLLSSNDCSSDITRFRIILYRSFRDPLSLTITKDLNSSSVHSQHWYRCKPIQHGTGFQMKSFDAKLSQEKARYFFDRLEKLGFWNSLPEVQSAIKVDDGDAYLIEATTPSHGYKLILRDHFNEFDDLIKELTALIETVESNEKVTE